MKKIISLIRASMTDGMSLFRVNTQKKSASSRILLPIFLSLALMGTMGMYSQMLMEGLAPINMEYVVLSIFIIFTSIITFTEGIYKSGGLLFNCKDDNMLLSLPIRKSTVLFIRVFKFYVFELLYNSLFLFPAMLVYAMHKKPDMTYYVVSFIGLLLFPIVPILLSCIVGAFITFIASKFKGKNQAQTILSVIFLLGVFYFSFNSENLIASVSEKATSINDFITKIYYPAGAYIGLVTNFNIIKLLEFILIDIGILILAVLVIGKFYFNINSSVKSISKGKVNKNYIIKTLSPVKSMIKKEFSRFINSPVFVTNAGFGLVIHVAACIFIAFKFNSVAEAIKEYDPGMTMEYLEGYIPVLMCGLVCFTSFMTSITSSMISIEGKSFSILKSLPIKPYKIIQSKVLTAILIMVPCILLGNIIVFVRFGLNLSTVILITIASVVLPFVSETFGIIVNLKYPRMDAKNDTEVVKQSMSSSVSVFAGMAMIGITLYLLSKALNAQVSNSTIIISFLAVYTIVYFGLVMYLRKISDKCFDDISV